MHDPVALGDLHCETLPARSFPCGNVGILLGGSVAGITENCLQKKSKRLLLMLSFDVYNVCIYTVAKLNKKHVLKKHFQHEPRALLCLVLKQSICRHKEVPVICDCVDDTVQSNSVP